MVDTIQGSIETKLIVKKNYLKKSVNYKITRRGQAIFKFWTRQGGL